MSPEIKEKPSFRLSEEDRRYLAVTILRNPWIPRSVVPTAKQAEFLSFRGLEQFFGGATGGGKTTSLLLAACQYLHVPGYAAVIFRRTFPMLSQSRGIMERATYWWHNSGAKWVEDEKRWYFPCKGGGFSSIKFSHMAQESDRYDHLSAEYQFIGFDELTEFLKIQYTFMFGRLRRTMDLVELDVPLRIFSGSNPGNIGMEWVRDRFIDMVPWNGGKLDSYYEEDADVWVPQPNFVPALLEDNPNVDRKSYLMSMANMDPIERQMYLKGNWRASQGGAQFKREWFAERMLDYAPNDLVIGVRHWDLAATAPLPGHEENKDADWTAGSMIFLTARGDLLIYDIQRFQGTPGTVEDRIKVQCAADYEMCFELGVPMLFSIEQEPGASGKIVVDDYVNRTLAGYPVIGIPSTGNKFLRSIPLSKQCQAGNVYMMKGFWNTAFFNEMDLYPYGDHDDQIDSCSGAANQLLDASFIRDAVPAVSGMFAWRS